MRSFCLAALLLPATAVAQDTVQTLEPEVIYEKVTTVDFERPVDVDGTLLTPSVKLVVQNRSQSFDPLIKLRTDFAAEIARSVHDVK